MPFPQGARWAVFSGVGNFMDSGVEVFRPPRMLTASGEIEQEDHQQLVICNSPATIEVRIPPGLHAGFRTTVVQAGDGVANILPTDGVTLEPLETGTAGKGSICLLLAVADDSFLLGGDTGPLAPIGEGEPGPTAPPVNVDVPYVSGNGVVGETLSATMGNWEGEPDNYAYQWMSDGAPVAAATDLSYVVDPADVGHSITCIVTATNAAGSTAAPPSNAVVVA